MSVQKTQHFLPNKKFSPLTPTTPTLNNSLLHNLYCTYLTVQTLISNPTLFIYTTELAASADLPSSSVRALFPYLLYTCYGRYSQYTEVGATNPERQDFCAKMSDSAPPRQGKLRGRCAAKVCTPSRVLWASNAPAESPGSYLF